MEQIRDIHLKISRMFHKDVVEDQRGAGTSSICSKRHIRFYPTNDIHRFSFVRNIQPQTTTIRKEVGFMLPKVDETAKWSRAHILSWRSPVRNPRLEPRRFVVQSHSFSKRVWRSNLIYQILGILDELPFFFWGAWNVSPSMIPGMNCQYRSDPGAPEA